MNIAYRRRKVHCCRPGLNRVCLARRIPALLDHHSGTSRACTARHHRTSWYTVTIIYSFIKPHSSTCSTVQVQKYELNKSTLLLQCYRQELKPNTMLQLTSDHGPANHFAGHFSLGISHSFVSLYFVLGSQRSSSTFVTPTPSNNPQKTRRLCIPLPHFAEHWKNIYK